MPCFSVHKLRRISVKMIFIYAVVFLSLSCADRSHRHEAVSTAGVELKLKTGADWSKNYRGYDPELPGFHLRGGIGTVILKRAKQLPHGKLVLEIETSPGMPPMLERFRITTGKQVIEAAPFKSPNLNFLAPTKNETSPAKTKQLSLKEYFLFETTDKTVLITFLPATWKLLPDEFEVSWVDWFRK